LDVKGLLDAVLLKVIINSITQTGDE